MLRNEGGWVASEIPIISHPVIVAFTSLAAPEIALSHAKIDLGATLGVVELFTMPVSACRGIARPNLQFLPCRHT